VPSCVLVVNGLSHGWADRRHTLQALAIVVGKGEFWKLGQPRGKGHDDNPSLGTGA
jgi:hypothetical protein